MTHLPRRSRRAVLTGSVAAVAVGALALTAAPAADARPGILKVAYDAVGTTHVAKTNNDIPLGPTVLTVKLKPDGSFTGSLPIPPQRTSFTVLGFLPVSATVNFIPANGNRQVTGLLTLGKVTSKARFYVNLSDVTVAGLPGFVGDHCQTVDPVVIPAATPAGQTFDLNNGGTLAGSYTIGQFANCGLQTLIINALIPGSGNTASIDVSNGRIVH